MPTLTVDGNHLVVLLSALEKIGALRGNISVPLASVRAVRVSDTPWSELRGIRAPGTGLPRVISLGTRRGPGVHDFAAVYGPRPALVVEMTGASFDRLVVSCADSAEATARAADITAHPVSRTPYGESHVSQVLFWPATQAPIALAIWPLHSPAPHPVVGDDRQLRV